jgi:hypothetical protein
MICAIAIFFIGTLSRIGFDFFIRDATPEDVEAASKTLIEHEAYNYIFGDDNEH